MDKIKLVCNSSANVPEFESEIKVVGGNVVNLEDNVITGEVPDGKLFFARIGENPRWSHSESSVTVPPPPPNPLEGELSDAKEALAAEKSAHAETQAALAASQSEIASVREHSAALAAELSAKATPAA